MESRGQWGSRVGFIMAAIGSAVGLGNIWRFPYMTASNGGGAFLIPYFVALFTAGIPLLILEFGLGHKFRTAAPGVFSRLNKKWEWIGWWQCAIAFFIVVYYIAIIAWALMYIVYSFNLSWGTNTEAFFYSNYLNITDGPFDLGGLRLKVLIPLIIVWGVTFLVLSGGVKGGIEKANKVFMPLLFILTIIITIRGLTLPGAVDGLNFLFTPDFSKILDGRVWVAAYGQIFFSLSIAFAIMITYSSYLPKKSDITNNAFITAFGDCAFSLLAGTAVFSIIGYWAYSQGAPVAEVAGNGGVGLAFIVFPMAINSLPTMNSLVGVLFFGSLLFAGLSSCMSIVEAFMAGIRDKFQFTRQKALNWSCGVGFIVSVIFATGAGLYILDIVDRFVNNYGVALLGLIEAILIGWFINLESIRGHVNSISDFSIGKWWNICIKFITPLLLGSMTVLNLIEDLTVPYGGYPTNALLTFGVAVAVIAMLSGFILSRFKWAEDTLLQPPKEVKF